jgi:UDP-N-acetyl-2-amino-2-deoxyglucuronate dehydrogenase
MSGKEIGAAVIGLGVGRAHAAAYSRLAGVRLVAIASVDGAALAKAAGEWPDAFVTEDFRAAIEHPDVDVVSICSPDRLHVEQSLYALARGRHVLCEKPIAIDLEGLAQLERGVAASGRTFAACHNYRFIPQFRRLRQMVAGGDVGPAFHVESSYVQDLWGMRALGPSYWRFADPQDLFVGGAVHNVDLLYWLAGEVEAVHSFASRTLDFWPTESVHTANLRFRSGCTGNVLLEVGSRRKRGFECRLRAFGPEGSVEAEAGVPVVIRDRGDGPGDAPETIAVAPANAHDGAVADFVDSVRQGRPPEVPLAAAAQVMAACYAVVRSAREGGVVAV